MLSLASAGSNVLSPGGTGTWESKEYLCWDWLGPQVRQVWARGQRRAPAVSVSTATATCLCWSATAPVLCGHVTTYHRLQRDSLFARLPKVFPDPGLALSGPIPGVDHVDTERTAGLPVDEEGGRKGTSGRATSSGSSRATHHMRDQVQCIFRVQPQGRTAQRCCFFISGSEKEKVDCCTHIELSDRQCCDL